MHPFGRQVAQFDGMEEGPGSDFVREKTATPTVVPKLLALLVHLLIPALVLGLGSDAWGSPSPILDLEQTSSSLKASVVLPPPLLSPKVVPTSVAYVATLAAGSGSGSPGDEIGDGLASRFRSLNGGFMDSSGEIYLVDTGNHRLKKFRPDQKVVHVAGRNLSGFANGWSYLASFNSPLGVGGDAAGIVYVADSGNHSLRRIDRQGNVTTLAGTGVAGSLDGPGATAQFNLPNDLVVAPDGTVFVSEFGGHRIRRVDADGTVSTWAGQGIAGFRDGPRGVALLSRPGGVALDAVGQLYFTEWGGHRIRRIDRDGVVTTLAGTGEAGYVDGPAGVAQFNNPDGLAVDEVGNVYVADRDNHSVRRLTPSGQVETLIGNGTPGSELGASSLARLWNPTGLGLQTNGVLYVVDSGNNRLLRLTSSGSAPVIRVEPRDNGALVGRPLSLSVQAAGPGTLQYQWYKADEAIPGAIAATLSIATSAVADSGLYSVVVRNASGQVRSRAARVRVANELPPVLVESPRGGTFVVGQPLELQVVAEGYGSMTYKWFKDGQSLGPPAYRIVGNRLMTDYPHTSHRSAGAYHVVVQDAMGSTASEPALWTMAPVPPPQIVGGIFDRSIFPGMGFGMQFTAVGTGPLWYVLSHRSDPGNAWSLVSSNLLGSFVLGVASPQHAGEYRLEVFDQAGHPPATQMFRVRYLPVRLAITRQPEDVQVPITGRIRLVAAAEGTPPLSYQWYQDGVPVEGARDPVLVLTHQPALDGASFTFRARDASESYVESRPAKVRTQPLVAAPLIVEQPLSIDLSSGASGQLSVRAISLGSEAGTESFQYQWFRHGEPMPHATAAELEVAEAMAEDSGVYTVRVTNAHGSVDSEQVGIRVLPVTQPLDPTLRVRQVAGGRQFIPGDVVGPPESALFSDPQAIAVSDAGEILVADSGNHRIKKIGRDGQVTHFAGTGEFGLVDGPAAVSRFYLPRGIAVSIDGTVYVADSHNHAVRRIAPDGSVSTLVGKAGPGFQDGPAGVGQLFSPVGIAVDSQGNVFVSEPEVHRVRRCAPDGTVTTVAGTRNAGFADGPTSMALFDQPMGLALDPAGNLFVADRNNHAIRRISTEGEVTTVAGNRRRGYVDGPVLTSRIEAPSGLALDADGNLFFSEVAHQAVRRLGIDGGITSVVGFVPGAAEPSGWVTQAGGRTPTGVAVSTAGDLYWTALSDNSIRSVPTVGSPHPYVRNVLESRPRGFWRFGETRADPGAEALGRMVARFEGVAVTLAPGVSRTGQTNVAIRFSDPTQAARVAYADAFNAGEFTVELWVKLETDGEAAPRRHQILSSADATEPRGYFLRATTPGRWEFGIGSGGGWQVLEGPPVVLGIWTHVSVGFDGSRARLAVNGRLVASAPMSLVPNRSGELRFGAALDWPAMKGLLDEVALYDSALPLARRLAHHASVVRPDGLSLGTADNLVSLVWFRGILETAPQLAGPWTPGASGRAPLTMAPEGVQQFFRLRSE